MTHQIGNWPRSDSAPTILAMDCAAATCSVALRRDGETAARQTAARRHGHAEILMSMIGQVLDQADCDYNRLDAVAVTVGPGAFTGLRIGLAAARGLGLALGIPVLGLSTLAVLAKIATPRDGAAAGLLLALDSRRGDYFAQIADRQGRLQGSPEIHDDQSLIALCGDLAPIRVAGDMAEPLAARLNEAGVTASPVPDAQFPDAAHLAALVESLGPAGCLAPDPLYIRAPEIKLRADGGRLRP